MSAVSHRLEIVVGTASAEQRVAALSKQFAGLKGASNNASDAIDDLAQSANNLGTSIDKNGRLRDANGRFIKMGENAKQASNGVDGLAKSTRKLGDNADYTSKLIGGLKGALAGYFSLAGLGHVLATADAMQTQNAQIKLVTESTEQYIAVKERLFQIAQGTRQDIEATTTAYTNNARSLQQLGKNQAEILKFTEAVSLAMAVGGKSAQEQASALVQLGQAMQSGVLQGDEFRSIAENAPILLDLVSKSLNKTRAEVRQLASDGKITAGVIYNAMAGASEELKTKYANMPVTMKQALTTVEKMKQALTTVENQYKRFVDNFMNGTGGISEKIASTILWVNEHFNSIIATLAGLTAIYGAYLVMNTAFVAAIPAKVAGLAASTAAFYQESVAMNANAAAKARAVMANMTLTNAASAMAIGVASAGVSVMNAAGFIDRKTASVVNASRSLAIYSANLVRTNGVLGATRLAIAGTTAALAAQARAAITSNAAKVALTATTRTMAGVMTTAGQAILSIGAIIKAHPLMILAGVITTVITATMGLEKAMESFGDAVTIVGYAIQDFVKWAVDGLTNKMGKAIDWMAQFFSKSSQDSTNKASAAFFGFFKTQEGGFVGLLRVVARAFDGITTVAKASMLYAGSQVEAIGARFKNAYNAMVPELLGGGGAMVTVNSMGFSDALAQSRSNFFEQSLDGYIAKLGTAKQNAAAANIDALGSVAGSAAANLNKLSQGAQDAQKGSGDKRKLKGKDGEYTYTASELKALQKVQGLIYGTELKTYAEQKGVPVNMLAGLMMQESRGEQYAKSPTGALGYFQTTSGYRKDMGLSESDSYNLVKSGRAAIDFLAKSYEKFGDWNTAILSYNAGRGGANQFKNTGRVAGSDARNREVREYVPRIAKWASYFNNGSSGLGKENNQAEASQQYIENQIEQTQKANDFLLQFTSEISRLAHERDKLIKEAQSYTGVAPQEQIDAAIKHAETIYDNKIKLIAAERNLEINGHRMSAEERMLREHEIYALKVALNEDYTSEEKRLLVESSKEKYEADLALFKENEQRKRAEIDKTIREHSQDYIRQDALNRLGRTSLGNQKLLELTYRQDDAENALNDQYESFKRDTIYARDDNGNFLYSLQERQELEKQAQEQHYKALEAMHRLHIDEMQRQKDENLSNTLQSYGALAEGMAGMFKGMMGEQSRAYRVMFAVSRAFAVAEAGKNVYLAASKAYAETPGAIWNKMAAAAKAIVTQGQFLTLIRGMQPQGFKTGGYTGNVGVNDIAGVVHGKEYVLNAQATKRIGTATLDRLNNGGDIGGKAVNITINVSSDGSSAVDAQGATQTAKAMADRIKAVVLETLRQERKQGGLLYA